MPVTISMPESASVLKWHKKEGDPVRKGDVLLEVETDKAVIEVPAEADGVLQKILAPTGSQNVPANEPLGLIATAAEPVAAAPAAAAPAAPVPADPAPIASTDPAAAAAPPARGARVPASPLARRLAREAGIDLARLRGSGPRGRVVERDVKAAIETGSAAPRVTPAEATPGDISPAPYEELPLDGMRRTIAERLLEAKRTVPHFYLTADIELTALSAMRSTLNADAPRRGDGTPAYKLSVNDFVIKALALALQRVPEANAVWGGDRLLRFRQSDIGVAVAVDGGGLYTPVIRAAEAKKLSDLSAEAAALAARARQRRLRPEEYRGGVSAVSNLGMYGVKAFSAIINPPHSSILAVGRAEPRVVVRNGAPTVVEAMTVTLSCDHRVLDGALGARLLSAFKELMEKPLTMLV